MSHVELNSCTIRLEKPVSPVVPNSLVITLFVKRVPRVSSVVHGSAEVDEL